MKPVALKTSCARVNPDEFFIGWLKMPQGYGRFLRWIVAGVSLVVIGIAAILSSQQQSPGTGIWETEKAIEFEGLAMVDPYAQILVPAPELGRPARTILLVEQGKSGAQERVRKYAGRMVRVNGLLIHRDDRWMLELAAEDTAIRAQHSSPAIASPSETDLGFVQLRGEIIDPKCYLGAMKPGGGKTHKACAVLCLKGGVPPMFVTRERDNRETFYLLTGLDGSAILDPILPYVGDPIEVSGNLSQSGDTRILRIDPTSIHRL